MRQTSVYELPVKILTPAYSIPWPQFPYKEWYIDKLF